MNFYVKNILLIIVASCFSIASYAGTHNDETFKQMDKDQDNTLSKHEAKNLLNEDDFNIADINKDGKLSLSEYDAYVQSKHSSVGESTDSKE